VSKQDYEQAEAAVNLGTKDLLKVVHGFSKDKKKVSPWAKAGRLDFGG